MGVIYYYTSVTGSMEIKKKQQKIEMILTSKKIAFEKIDIAQSEEDKKKMRALMNDEKGLPPQLVNGDQYCGSYEAFEEAVENECVEKFLKLS